MRWLMHALWFLSGRVQTHVCPFNPLTGGGQPDFLPKLTRTLTSCQPTQHTRSLYYFRQYGVNVAALDRRARMQMVLET